MTHLLVIQADGSHNVELYNPRRNDFVWNADYTAFQVVRLRWWDDRSYIAYQCGEDGDMW